MLCPEHRECPCSAPCCSSGSIFGKRWQDSKEEDKGTAHVRRSHREGCRKAGDVVGEHMGTHDYFGNENDFS